MKRFHYTPAIPMHVYLTWFTHTLPPLMRENLRVLREGNPKFAFHLYDDDECREFIQQNFEDDVVVAFDTLVPGAYKADLWRLCILYKLGGVYMDIKLQCINGFALMELSENEHFVRDRPSFSLHIYNAFMICKAGNPFLKACIQQIVYNTQTRQYGPSMLSPTGPELLGRMAHSFRIPIDLEYPVDFNNHIKYQGRLILKNYVGYREEQQRTCKLPHYSTLWCSRSIFAKTLLETDALVEKASVESLLP